MNEIIEAIKDMFNAAIALGWQPWPTVIASVTMLVARALWEPSVLAVNDKESLAKMGRIKGYIFLGVFLSSFIIHIGISKPATAWDWCSSIGFCIGHTMFAYVISSSSKVRSIVKLGFEKENENEKTNPAS